MSGPDIFISYNREDAAIARLYADAFSAAGLKVWWDATLRSGEDYDAVTEDSLRTAKAVVVLWSPRSVHSRWVRAEATIADRGQTLMPVMIEPCDRPVMFELKQTAELSHWRGDITDKSWLALVADVKRKVGMEPDDDRTEAAPAVRVAAAASTATLGRPAVAVLPFGWRGGDGELENLAEDLTEDVTRELAYNGYFKVIAAGTMAAWRGKSIDHKDLGKRLDARYLVEGRLQRSGTGHRLTAQLIDGSSGNVLWSLRMAPDTSEPDFSADTLSVAVAAQFAEQIVQRELASAMTRSAPYSPLDHILRSLAYSRRGDEEGAVRAVAEAQLAVDAAPDIGLAHASLASALAALPESRGLKPDEEQIREIQSRTRQAMRLDGNNATVLMSLAGAYQGLGEYEVCLRLARRTVDLWPSSPSSYLVLGDSYRMLGRVPEAITAYRRQDQLAPFDGSRNVALTHLGMCLLLEDRAAEAEEALDRALSLDPEYSPALVWKAIVADHLGKDHDALETVRQLRTAEAAMPLDRYVRHIERNEHLRARTAVHVTALRRLWRAAGTEPGQAIEPEAPAAEPVVVSAAQPVPVPEFEMAEPARAETAELALADAPAPVEAEPLPAVEPEPAPQPLILAEEPVAKQPAAKRRKAPSDAREAYVLAADAPQAAVQPANDAGEALVPPARRSALPRAAMIAGALVLAGGGAAAWVVAKGGKAESGAPAFVLAEVPNAAPALAEASVGAVTSAAPLPLTDAMAALIAVSKSARRPAAELAALEAGQRTLLPLLAQGQAAPADQLKAITAGLVQQQGPALSADADRLLREQQQAAANGKGLAPDGAAKVERALARVRGARAEIATALGTAGQAPDALTMLVAQRGAVAAFVRMQSVPVSATVASARMAATSVVATAAADTAKMANRLSRARVDIASARTEVSHLSSQIAGLAQVEKPGLFASGAKRQSFRLRKDNADRSRALVAEADQILSLAGAAKSEAELSASLARLRGLRSQASTLLAASNAALKAGAAAAQSPSPTPSASATSKR